MNLETKMREAAASWVRTASLDELAKLPAEIFFPATSSRAEAQAEASVAHAPSKPKASRGRRRKRARGKVTKDHAEVIRMRLHDLKPGTKQYVKERNNLSRELKYSVRQIASAANGPERAAKRKKGSARKK